MIETRQRPLNSSSINSNGKNVIYVMSRDQRLHDNHALLLAQERALKHKVPLIIVFNFYVSKHRSREHYRFMLDGLSELEQSAQDFTITTLFYSESTNGFVEHISSLNPVAVYFDFSPLSGPTRLRSFIANNLPVACYEVDTHNIIPVWVASDHQEFAAHTFRSKVHKLLPSYLKEPPKIIKHPYPATIIKSNAPLHELGQSINNKIKPSGITIQAKPGEVTAKKHLNNFVETRLKNFALLRNDPSQDGLSNLSPYLHFGHISSLRVALEVLKATNTNPLLFNESRMPSTGDTPSLTDGMNTLFEEMIVRKELSDNFCLYAKDYLDFSSVSQWAQTTLQDHSTDKREFIYSRQQWEDAKTHDPAWNAAQNQLRTTGKIHGYMRMYWAKKMLEWSKSPKQALADCAYLNDKYSVDGGDPNGYVGILWSIAGLHDRPWTERPVFGKIRYMNYGGLKRKFDIEKYTQTWVK